MDLTSMQDAIEALKICDNNFEYDGINCRKCPLRDERWDGAWQDNETNCCTKLMRDSAKLLEKLSSAQPDPCVFCKFGDGDCWEVCQYCPAERRTIIGKRANIVRQRGEPTTDKEKDRIECAIRHIQTAVDVDPWAVEIAVEAMEKQIPKKPVMGYAFAENIREVMKRTDPERAESRTECCPVCGRSLGVSQFVKAQKGLRIGDEHCKRCGQTIDWEDE